MCEAGTGPGKVIASISALVFTQKMYSCLFDVQQVT